ncbi:MAG: hypothetical protein M4579_004201 [Chaenotheca gracillima]|nr:MAG: hypothetical protein M4579_004201 [Chaenotheca gracillima]
MSAPASSIRPRSIRLLPVSRGLFQPRRCLYAPPTPPTQRAGSLYGHDRPSPQPPSRRSRPQDLRASSPLLDFLAPTLSRRPSTHLQGFSERVPAQQAFSTSTRRTLNALHNPRKDEEGNEMTIDISPRASHRLQEIMKHDKNPSLALRITVESGGCHGFQYLMSLTDLHAAAATGTSSEPSSENASSTAESGANEDEDTIFEASDGTGAKVVMDEPSLELLKGSKVDYTMELIGSQFKIVDNPLATSSCGCGTSFDIKG